MKLGADIVIDPVLQKSQLMKIIDDNTDDIGADIVFECSGNKDAFLDSIKLVKKDGQIVIVGFGEKDVPVNFLDLVLKEIELKAILGYNNEFEDVIDFLKKKKIQTEFFIDDIIKLENLEIDGFKRILKSSDLIKILVTP